MKDLDKYIKYSDSLIRSLGIVPGNIVEYKINTRAKHRFGQCSTAKNGFSIQISARLLKDDAPDKLLIVTLIHEMLHTCRGSMKHTGEWKKNAAAVSENTEYRITRLVSGKDYGLTDDTPPKIKIPKEARYILKCTGCGAVVRRERKTIIIKHPERYRCSKCNSKIVRIK